MIEYDIEQRLSVTEFLETPGAKLILLSAPAAISYYPKIGMTQHEFCYYLDDVNKLK